MKLIAIFVTILFAAFVSTKELTKDEICALPSLDGNGRMSCMAYIPSYFHNTATGKCEEFIYGGCGGNENRFASKAKCEEFCKGIKPDEQKSKD